MCHISHVSLLIRATTYINHYLCDSSNGPYQYHYLALAWCPHGVLRLAWSFNKYHLTWWIGLVPYTVMVSGRDRGNGLWLKHGPRDWAKRIWGSILPMTESEKEIRTEKNGSWCGPSALWGYYLFRGRGRYDALRMVLSHNTEGGEMGGVLLRWPLVDIQCGPKCIRHEKGY